MADGDVLMFQDRTVFVVGAGASVGLGGFPLGSTLAKTISKNLSKPQGQRYALNDEAIHNLVHKHCSETGANLNKMLSAAALIADGLHHADSIDQFIDMHSHSPEVALLGKWQIAMELLKAEAKSFLYVPPDNSKSRLKFGSDSLAAGWLQPFTRILLSGAHATELDSVGVGLTVICFNYDRCIEQYLTEAISRTLDVSYGTAHRHVYEKLKIIHPYGTLGKLPAERSSSETADGAVPFGSQSADPRGVASNLSTFTEEIDDKGQLDSIGDAIAGARNLVFLGFSFGRQNMELLKPSFKVQGLKNVYASTYKMHAVSNPAVKEGILRMMRGKGGDAEFQRFEMLSDLEAGAFVSANAPNWAA